MKLLGIDYGSKKIGLALSDEAGRVAFPHSVLENNQTFLDRVVTLIEEEKVDAVVIGHSRNYEGKDNPIMKQVNSFIDALNERIAIPVHLESEVLTTREAARAEGGSGNLDASAAAIILNSFIERKEHTHDIN